MIRKKEGKLDTGAIEKVMRRKVQQKGREGQGDEVV